MRVEVAFGLSCVVAFVTAVALTSSACVRNAQCVEGPSQTLNPPGAGTCFQVSGKATRLGCSMVVGPASRFFADDTSTKTTFKQLLADQGRSMSRLPGTGTFPRNEASSYGLYYDSGDAGSGDEPASTLSISDHPLCAPGSSLVYLDGTSHCHQTLKLPNPLDDGAAEPNVAPTASIASSPIFPQHLRECGRWIDDQPATQVVYRTWEKETETIASMYHQIQTKLLFPTNPTNAAYAMRQCLSMRASASRMERHAANAYETILHDLKTMTTPALLATLGSMGCGGGVTIRAGDAGGMLSTWLLPELPLEEADITSALVGVGETANVLNEAIAGAQWLEAQHVLVDPTEAATLVQTFLVPAFPGIPMDASKVSVYDTDSRISALVALSSHNPAHARSYAKAVLAQCAMEVVDVEGSVSTQSILRLDTIEREKGSFEEPTAEDVDTLIHQTFHSRHREKKTRRLRRLQSAPGEAQDSTDECANAVLSAFDDEVDEMLYDTMVKPLGSMLLEVVNELRAHLQQTVTQPKFASTLKKPQDVVTAISNTRVIIPGAPRGSAFGLQHPKLANHLMHERVHTSGTGFALSVMLQQRSEIENKVADSMRPNAGVCDTGPIYTSLDSNGYIYPGSACTHVLLGLFAYPMAHPRFSKAALASRIGYVVAHEMSHQTLVSEWNDAEMAALLDPYQSNHYAEAIADVLAIKAIADSGIVTPSTDVCRHVASIWCARVPENYTPSTGRRHPLPNERGDFACHVLKGL